MATGLGHSFTAVTVFSSILTPSPDMIQLRNVTVLVLNPHFQDYMYIAHMTVHSEYIKCHLCM